MKKLLITLLILAFVFFILAKLASAEETQTDEEYLKKLYYQGVQGEIERRHEKEMADRQIEILGRLQMLGASQNYVSQGVSVSTNTVNNSSKVKVKV